MEFLIPSFIAGFLTVLAPCVFSLLPVILGGSIDGKNKLKPLIVTVSLGLSVFIFTLLLKGTTAFIDIPTSFWNIVSGIIITFIGFTMLFPKLWEHLAFTLKFYKTEGFVGRHTKRDDIKGAVLLGASLGPVFSTCSPTYGIIVATVLPGHFVDGVLDLFVYVFGLMIPLIVIGYGGRVVIDKLRFAANPEGLVKRTFGILMLLTGLLILTGFDKQIESAILNTGYNGPIKIEQSILPKTKTFPQ